MKIDDKEIVDERLVGEINKTIENYYSPLGKETLYISNYAPDLIYPVSRRESRRRIGNIDYKFEGIDIWNTYEFSALDLKGQPYCKILKLGYDCHSESIVESKSLKLYLNSFNQTKISFEDALKKIIDDLSKKLKTNIFLISTNSDYERKQLVGLNLDRCDTTGIFEYNYNPLLLKAEEKGLNYDYERKMYFDSFKSNCRHSGLPDWGTVIIHYRPNELILNEESLLKYLISYRNFKDFHEECCERIVYDIMKAINPKRLVVSCNYTRRGGIDINPIRVAGEVGEFSYEKLFNDFRRVNNQ